jgi:hypothetical protein
MTPAEDALTLSLNLTPGRFGIEYARLLDWKYLDLKRYEAAFGKLETKDRADVAYQQADIKYRRYRLPAIRDLEGAKAKATEAGKSLIISKDRKAQAKVAAKALEEPIRVLKAIHIDDFKAEVDNYKVR